jgi:hypothetical protein
MVKQIYCIFIHICDQGMDSKGNAMVAINIRCLEDIELEKVAVSHYDGRAR